MIITNNITGETREIEEIINTPIEQTVEQKRQIILNELDELDKVINRTDEEIAIFVGMPLYPATQVIVDRKNELRELLKLT